MEVGMFNHLRLLFFHLGSNLTEDFGFTKVCLNSLQFSTYILRETPNTTIKQQYNNVKLYDSFDSIESISR